jgi:hypothetical protein
MRVSKNAEKRTYLVRTRNGTNVNLTFFITNVECQID